MFHDWTYTDSFYLTTAYGILSIALSLFILIIVIKNLKTFDSSFFQLYIYDSILNMSLHFINYISMRLTLIATKDSRLGLFFAGLTQYSFLLNFMQAMRYHMAYVQYTIITLISLNRLSVLLKFTVWEPRWKKYSSSIIAAIVILPLLSTYPVFFSNTTFEYDAAGDIYSLNSDVNVGRIYAVLIPYMGFNLVTSLAANITSFTVVRSRTTLSKRRAEISFLVIMTITCTIELVGTIISICLIYYKSNMADAVYHSFRTALPYVSDALTLVQPWLLLIFSHAIREKIRQLLHLQPLNAVMFKPSSITRVT